MIENKSKTTKVIPPFRRLLSKLPTWSVIVANAMHSWVMPTLLWLLYLNVYAELCSVLLVDYVI